MSDSRPERLYVVVGRQVDGELSGGEQPMAEYTEPPYPTNPAHYGLTAVDPSEDEFVREIRFQVKAFTNREDAIDFGCRLSRRSVACLVYDRAGDEWVENATETSSMADEFE